MIHWGSENMALYPGSTIRIPETIDDKVID